MQNVYKRINAIGDKATDNLQGPTKITPKKKPKTWESRSLQLVIKLGLLKTLDPTTLHST